MAGTPGWVAVRGSTWELPAGMVTFSSKLPRPVKPVVASDRPAPRRGLGGLRSGVLVSRRSEDVMHDVVDHVDLVENVAADRH